jgi:hypothetical protein
MNSLGIASKGSPIPARELHSAGKRLVGLMVGGTAPELHSQRGLAECFQFQSTRNRLQCEVARPRAHGEAIICRFSPSLRKTGASLAAKWKPTD